MSGTKPIVLIEDDPYDVDLIVTALTRSGSRGDVEVLRSGEDAINYFNRIENNDTGQACGTKVVFLDIKLPKIDGLQVLERLKAHPTMKTIPVVMLTSSAEARDVARSYELGVNAYVVKPVSF